MPASENALSSGGRSTWYGVGRVMSLRTTTIFSGLFCRSISTSGGEPMGFLSMASVSASGSVRAGRLPGRMVKGRTSSASENSRSING